MKIRNNARVDLYPGSSRSMGAGRVPESDGSFVPNPGAGIDVVMVDVSMVVDEIGGGGGAVGTSYGRTGDG